MRIRPACLALVFLLASAGVAHAKKPEWIELRSPHFHVISNAKPKKVAKVTQQLEDFRHLIGLVFPGLRLDPPTPTQVLFFKNKKSFRPYAPLTPDGKPKKVTGYMQTGRERMYLVVNLGTREAVNTAFHEYMHLILRLNSDRVPLWLNEGLAQYYERTEINGDRFKLGLPQGNTWRFLQDRGLIPLEVLVAVDYQSEYYNVPKKQQQFYAQSWLLVHYLLVGEKGSRENKLARFVQLLRQGLPQEAAFREAFATDYAGMGQQLEDYLTRRKVMAFEGTFPEPPERKPLESSPLSPAVAQAYAADLWLNSGRVAEAEQALRALAGAQPAPPEVLYRLGRLALERGQALEAEKHFQTALATQPDDIGLRYYAAWAVNQGRFAVAEEEEERRAAATEIIELLSPLLETANPFPDAYHLLLQARMARDDPAAELIPLLQRLRQLRPQVYDFDFLLASLYGREQRWEDAEKVLQSVLARSTSNDDRARAQELLQRVQRAREFEARKASGAVSLVGEPAEAQPVPREDPVEPPPAPAPPAPPKVSYLRGTLVNVACSEDDSAVLTVREQSKKKRNLQLAVRSRTRVILLDPTESGQTLACGPSGVRVGINYRVEPQGPSLAGVVMTIEFNPPSR